MLKFFLNPETSSYLRGLAQEFEESTNSVRIELNRMRKAGLLDSETSGRKKVYRANTKNPLFPEIHNMVKKFLGIDIVEKVVNNLGNVEAALITGDYAKGKDSGIIDLVIVGKINKSYLNELVILAEENIKRKIRTLVLDQKEFSNLQSALKPEKALFLWNNSDNSIDE